MVDPNRDHASSEEDTFVVHRQMNATQRARRARIVTAAMELAAAGGYDAVMMKEVASRAGVSLGTLYRYFSSKDHLLAEALRVWGQQLSDRLLESPPQGASPAARVGEVFRRMARGVEQAPELGVALTRALLSRDPSALQNRDALMDNMQIWIASALGDTDVADREGLMDALAHLCFAYMITLANGQRSPREVGDALERAARLMLPA